MKGDNVMTAYLRAMTPDDYKEVHQLWESIHGFALRSIDDSEEGVLRFLERNPGTSVVALAPCDDPGSTGVQRSGEEPPSERIIGSILCGHDGRTGYFYHVCVEEEYRRHGIGKDMVVFCMNALMKEKINTISLIAFNDNETGNAFWNGIGWTRRSDVNQYEFKLNKDNIIAFTN